MFQARNIKHLHEPLICNSGFRSCKPLVFVKNRCQAPPLQFSQASHETTSSMLKIRSKKLAANNNLKTVTDYSKSGNESIRDQSMVHIPSLVYNELGQDDSLHLHCRKVNKCKHITVL